MTHRLAAFLSPCSIALVGVPSDLTRPGARPLVFLRKHGYAGRIYPVNPRRDEIGGLRAYPSLAALPEAPDTVWIGVPGGEVLGVLEEAARLKIPNAVILTAGFGETNEGGRRRQAALRETAERGGVTVLGPNMLGFINFWDRVPLTFSASGGVDQLIPGPVGVASQSGALGGVVVNRAYDRRIGLSAMISTGNEAGITVTECLEHFASDPRTDVVALIAEGIRDGERFKRAAARLLETGKPLVALKVGRSSAGRRNALTHTGALAGSGEAWRAVARQLGIVEVDTFEDLVEVAGFFARERRPIGRRACVLATSGGASIMTADHLDAHGFALPRLAKTTRVALGEALPAYALTRDNPVDVTAGLPETLFVRVLAALTSDPRLDVIVSAVTGASGVERAQSLVGAAREASRPVVACWLGGSQTEDGLAHLDAAGLPAFRSPRTAALALAAARELTATRAAWRARRLPSSPAPVALPPGRTLPYATLSALARRAGVPLARQALVKTPAQAAAATRGLGARVAVKLVGPGFAHKTEAGALVLDVGSPAAAARAAAALLRRARGAAVEGVLVQRMAPPGIEVLAGVTRDRTFGPLLTVGAGGVAAELLGGIACRPLPVTSGEIRAMLKEVRLLRALDGFRGAAPSDMAALVRAVAAVARLAALLGERLESVEVNPVIVSPRGAVAVDLLAGLRASSSARRRAR